MDGERFDAWIRSLAAGTSSRRRVLKALTGGLAGAVAGTVRSAVAAPKKCGGTTCAASETCVKPAGGKPVCCPSARACGQTCCTGGQICCGGTCVANNTTTNCLTCGTACTGGKVCGAAGCVCPNACAAPLVLNTTTCACECSGGCSVCEACDPVRGCVSTGVDSFVVFARPPCGSGPTGCFCSTDKSGQGYCASSGSCQAQTLTCITDADCEAQYGPGSVCAPTASPGCFGGVACLTPCANP